MYSTFFFLLKIKEFKENKPKNLKPNFKTIK